MGDGGSSGTGRGRPQRLRDDPTPVSSRHVAVESRIGWLLATTRILHPDPARRPREAFCALAAARGLHVDASRVSRWEGGVAPAGREVVEAYEAVLGRPPGSLQTIAAGMRRELGAPLPRDEPRRPLGVPETLLDDVIGGARVTGAQWQELTRSLRSYDALYLRADEWETLATRLVAELGRSTRTAYVRRFDAAAGLVRHPSAQRHLARALGGYVVDPDAQVVLPVLRLLTEVDDAAASTLVLRMVGDDHPRLNRAAASVAAAKLRRGTLPGDAQHRLEAYVAATLAREESVDAALDAVDVAVQLPLPSFRHVLGLVHDRALQELLTRSRATSELVAPAYATAVATELAAAAQADGVPQRHPDLMLRRLLREALFHVHRPRRHHAAVLLAASPYRPALSHLLSEVARDSPSVVAARAWALLMWVGYPPRGGELLARATGEPRPDLRARAMVVLGLDASALSPAQEAALVASVSPADREPLRHGMCLALGMRGSPLLAGLAEHGSEDVRRAARWWLAQGPAIHEPGD